MKRLLIAASLLAAPGIAKDKTPDHVYGPPPAWEEYRALAETEITNRLSDPDSARIEWLGSYKQGGFKPLLQGRVKGYVACGLVNARNRMGGYAGRTNFVVVIDYGRVLFAEIDSKPGGMISGICSDGVRSGMFPPLPPAGAANPGVAATAPSASGLSLRAMPDGAYVSAVTEGSLAALAGLKAGMVIGSVNGIPLAGMGDAMTKVVEAAGPGASLAIVGGGTIQLGAKR